MNVLTEIKKSLGWGKGLICDLLKVKNLGYLTLSSALLALIVGVLLFVVDANVKTPWDGVWSAWVTMTHVGFGDVVPVSFIGRVLAAGLILMGLVFFSLFTATVSVALIGKNIDAYGAEAPGVSRTASAASGETRKILDELGRLHARMEALEQQLKARADGA